MRNRILVAAIILLALAAIVHSWTIFGQVIDEPAHVAAGVEWLDTGHYRLDPQHPPLARILLGLGPILRGATYEVQRHWMFAGNAILYGNGEYLATLASARAGTLPFFLLACGVVVAWTRRSYGMPAALAALLLFATQSSVIAHAALATTDMAAAATIAAVLFAFQTWLERPTALRATLLGLATGVAVACKFSAIVFLPAAFLAMLAVTVPRPRRDHLSAAIAIAAAVVTILAVYRFDASAFFAGIEDLRSHNRGGHPAYLFGMVGTKGWWFYFPIALWLKSTLPLLVAFGIGTVVLLRKRTESLAPLVAGAAILAVAMASSISIGVRHVLPLYPLMAMIGGHGLATLRRPLAAVIVVAQLASFALAHPDHLAYFNLTAGRDPARLLLDSNLDWGQDLLRLEDEAARRGVGELHIAIFTSADLRRERLPPLRPLLPFTPVRGWVAISEMNLKDLGARGRPRGGYDWLQHHEPVAKVGSSIWLYRLP